MRRHAKDRQIPHPRTRPCYLGATAAWLLRSIDNGEGGWCAYFSPATGWSNPYPETTGYLIPMLIELLFQR